ncbi:hypothetical protein F5Y04DRAFT_200043 [Hypomontagnella monticulosa]|nr:hypothetical protein F5Y04DRAFT_200043 [Hypomontagnella monticulosa]
MANKKDKKKDFDYSLMLATFGIPQPKYERHLPAEYYASPSTPKKEIDVKHEKHHKSKEVDMKHEKHKKHHAKDEEKSHHWSKEDDGMICFMKQSDMHLKTVASVLGRTEKETRERYKYLKSLAKNDGFTLKMRADIHKHRLLSKKKFKDMDVTYETGREKHKLAYESGKVVMVIQDESDGRGKSRFIFERARGLSPVADPESEYDSDIQLNTKPELNFKFEHKSKDHKKSHHHHHDHHHDHDKHKHHKHHHHHKHAELPKVRIEHNRTDIGYTDAVDVLEAKFPNGKRLTPDTFWSERDCRALSAIEAKYQENKWLTIQADFANYTGRMIDVNVLQAKFCEPPPKPEPESESYSEATSDSRSLNRCGCGFSFESEFSESTESTESTDSADYD